MRSDGCGFGFKRFLGTITGQVSDVFTTDIVVGGQLERKSLPLEGLEVSIMDHEGLYSFKLGESLTDSDGEFSISVNTCQSILEGDDLGIYVRVKAKNPTYDIKGRNKSILILNFF